MNVTPTIRQATPQDLPQIKAIIDMSFPRFFRFFATRSVSDFEEPTLVAEIEGAAVGFAKLIQFQVGQDRYGCILWIAVHPDRRRRGVALALLNSGVGWFSAHDALAVFASTQRGNRGALAVLGGAGFRRVGFLRLWEVFRWRVFEFYGDIWFAPGEVVLMVM